MEKLLAVLREIRLDAAPVSCEPCGNGHIDLNFLARTESGRRYILQKINRSTFRNVAGLMEKITHITDYLRQRVEASRGVLTLVPTNRGGSYLEHDGEAWRVYELVEGSILQFHRDVTLICDEAAASRLPEEA